MLVEREYDQLIWTHVEGKDKLDKAETEKHDNPHNSDDEYESLTIEKSNYKIPDIFNASPIKNNTDKNMLSFQSNAKIKNYIKFMDNGR